MLETVSYIYSPIQDLTRETSLRIKMVSENDIKLKKNISKFFYIVHQSVILNII